MRVRVDEAGGQQPVAQVERLVDRPVGIAADMDDLVAVEHDEAVLQTAWEPR